MSQVATAAASPAGKRIRCSQLGAPGVVLAGDAAHAVTPVFGQGANSSLESARVLGLALEEAKVRVVERLQGVGLGARRGRDEDPARVLGVAL